MKLALDATSPWPIVRHGEATSDFLPQILIVPFEALARPSAVWKRKIFETALPTGARVEVSSDSRSASTLEWPIDIVEAKAFKPDGTALEDRLLVQYFMFQFSTTAMFRCAPGSLEKHRIDALAVLTSGRPNTSGEVATIAELYE
jgi:hypothetical protein